MVCRCLGGFGFALGAVFGGLGLGFCELYLVTDCEVFWGCLWVGV